MKEWTIVNATCWTKRELIPHIAKRNRAGVNNWEFFKDIGVAVNIIKMQATHLQESSAALAREAEKLRFDLEKRNAKES